MNSIAFSFQAKENILCRFCFCFCFFFFFFFFFWGGGGGGGVGNLPWVPVIFHVNDVTLQTIFNVRFIFEAWLYDCHVNPLFFESFRGVGGGGGGGGEHLRWMEWFSFDELLLVQEIHRATIKWNQVSECIILVKNTPLSILNSFASCKLF